MKMSLPLKFIEQMRNREASSSIGPSTARSMGTGTVDEARRFLKTLDVKCFVTDSANVFRKQLDAATMELSQSLTCRSWGAARKFLNIYLRGVLYNRHLCDHFGYQVLEPFLEVPLDSHVARGLRDEEGGRSRLPRWRTIIGLTTNVSDAYQDFAEEVARSPKYQVARVHLDIVYWRRDALEA
jgi:hypothetical protein